VSFLEEPVHLHTNLISQDVSIKSIPQKPVNLILPFLVINNHTKQTAVEILYEKGMESKTFGDEVYYTACSLTVIFKNREGNFIAKKF
jgi:hypothetical protein